MEGDRAIFESSWLKSKYNGQCLTFWYSMYGTQMGSLIVKLIGSNNSEHVVFEKSGNQGNVGWLKGSSFIPDNYLYKIRFEAVRGVGSRSDLALDYVIVKDLDECQVMHCSFEEHNTCQLDGQLDSKGTRDFFIPFLGLNYYQFKLSADRPKADLNLPFFDFQHGQSVCLSFSFNFVGERRKSLSVYVVKDDFYKQLVWSTGDAEGSPWSRAYADIANQEEFQLYNTYKIIFEAKLLEDAKNQSIVDRIEIDEINISKSYCSTFK